MRIFGFEHYGGPEVMGFIETPRPQPGESDVLIELRAASINPADIKVRSGQRKASFPVAFPMAMGREAAGVVCEAPSGSPLSPGQLVYGGTSTGTGALAEYVLLDAQQTAAVPAGVSAAEAACIPVAYGTAWDALHELALPRGSTLLVLGAGGGVGSAAVQCARALGLGVVGVASAAKKDLVEGLGAAHVAYDSPNWMESLHALCSTYAGIIDAAGGGTLRACAPLTAAGKIRSAADPALATALGGSGVTRRRRRAVYEEIASLVAQGTVRIPLAASYSFDETACAIAAVESGHSTGKTVVTGPQLPGR